MSNIDKNIHDMSVLLGIKNGTLTKERENNPFTPEWFKEKGEEFKSEETKAKELYADFTNNYSPLALKKFKDEELLKKLFLGNSSENLAHTLEYVSVNVEYFGSIKGGNAYKYPLHFDLESSSWVSGTCKNPKYLTLSDAINVGNDVVKFLYDACELVKRKKPLDSVEKYIELYAELYSLSPDYSDDIWFLKYLHMIFPEDFSTFYNEKWQKIVLETIGVVPSDSSFGRTGQIMLFIRECEISPVVFNKVFHKYAKNYQENLISLEIDETKRVTGGENIILYGVPGAGKSWAIKNEYCKDESFMERIVFHPDYTYSDFVGQILPKVDEEGHVTYAFTPGPFTKIVKEAYLNPLNKYFLVIEEINRGNAPAIFGDIFQLLDRNKENGSSEYAITNADIARVVYGDENHKVSIPSNMSILCTMNTSDQNVFTLDTAFQRRWSMRLVQNKFPEDGSESDFANTKILDTSVTWEKFFTEINDLILKKNIRMTSSEDKRLGTHFVSKNDLLFVQGDVRQNSKFAEKVLKYLWDDAFKFNKDELFDLSKVNSLEKVITKFVNNTGDNRFIDIFKQNIYDAIITKSN